MGEPGHVSERTVWSVARVLWSHYDSEYGGAEPEDFIDEARAALTAAAPLMHEECRRLAALTADQLTACLADKKELRAENARLREALEGLTDAVAGTQRIKWSKSSTLRRALYRARAALAHSDGEPGT